MKKIYIVEKLASDGSHWESLGEDFEFFSRADAQGCVDAGYVECGGDPADELRIRIEERDEAQIEITYTLAGPTGGGRVDSVAADQAALDRAAAKIIMEGGYGLDISARARRTHGLRLNHRGGDLAARFAREATASPAQLRAAAKVCFAVPPGERDCWPGGGNHDEVCDMTEHAASAAAVAATADLGLEWEHADLDGEAWITIACALEDAAKIIDLVAGGAE